MSEIKQIIMLSILLIGIVIGISIVFGELLKELDKQSADLRSHSSETKYEYKVLSVEHKTGVFECDCFKVTYLDSDNTIRTIKLKPNDKFHFIQSNESKFIIENPEYNGYPLRYVLYGSLPN